MLIVDASVWVSAADATDTLSEPSRTFLSILARRSTPVALPDFGELEVACALARRLGDGQRGKDLAGQLLRSPLIAVHSLDSSLLRRAGEVGTRKLLRAEDAVYAAVGELTGGVVVSWDGELMERAGTVTPREWMEENERQEEDREGVPGDELE
ncbi:MAG: PIN domain-containing protein [Gemmatimonadota bacterium]|nr:PIN domain-containing protein [Gemmatimonadota bacterium]